MEFRIQYFGQYDLLLYGEVVDAETLDDALGRARAIVHERYPSFADPAIIGYVILDDRGAACRPGLQARPR